jgi:hypothetical protein
MAIEIPGWPGPIDNLRAQQARLADEKSRLERKIQKIEDEDEDDLDAADLADLDEKKANLATIDLQFIVANLQVKWYAEASSPDTNQALFKQVDQDLSLAIKKLKFHKDPSLVDLGREIKQLEAEEAQKII